MKASLSKLICLLLFNVASYNTFCQTNIVPQRFISPEFTANGGTSSLSYLVKAASGNVYMAGSFTNTVDFDLGKDTFNITNNTGQAALYISKYSSAGKRLFSFEITAISGFGSEIYPTAFTSDSLENIYACGNFSGTVDFDPTAASSVLSTSDNYTYNMFFAKYSKDGRLIFVKMLTANARRPYEETINKICVDRNQNIYLAGACMPGFVDFDPGPKTYHPPHYGGGDAYFARYAANGNFIFAKTIGSPGIQDVINDMFVDKKKNILITGPLYQNNDVDPNAGVVTFPVKKIGAVLVGIYDSLGNYTNAFYFGNYEGTDIVEDNDNNIIVSGLFDGRVDFDPGDSTVRRSSDSDVDVFVAKYTFNGKLLFANTIQVPSLYELYSGWVNITVDSLNNIYAGGTFTDKVVFKTPDPVDSLSGYGNIDSYVAKYNPDGKLVYVLHPYDTSGDYLNNIDIAGNNKMIVYGGFEGRLRFDQSNLTQATPGAAGIYANYTQSGKYLNSSKLETYKNYNQLYNIVRLTHDDEGNTYVTGTYEGKVDFDPGPDTFYLTSLSNGSNDNYNNEQGFFGDIFFAKYNAKGELIFAKSISGTQYEGPASITIDSNYNIYLCGYFESTVDFDPGIGTAYLNADHKGLFGSFFAKYDAAGNYIFAKPIYMNFHDDYNTLKDIAVDKNENIYLTGTFNLGYFDASNDTLKFTATGNNDVFIAKYTNAGQLVFFNHIGKSRAFTSGHDIKINTAGNIVVGGDLDGSNIDFDPGVGIFYLSGGVNGAHFIASYTTAGNFIYATGAQTETNGSVQLTRMAIDNNDNTLITGYFRGPVNFGTTENPFIIDGKAPSNVFFSRYDKYGKFLFAKSISIDGLGSGNPDLYTFSINTDTGRNIYITGYMTKKTDFDPSGDTAYLYIPNRNFYGFLARYDTAGNYIYAYNFGSPDSIIGRVNLGTDLFINKNSDVVIGFSCDGKTDFDPGPGTKYFVPSYEDGVYEYRSYLYRPSVIVSYKQLPIFLNGHFTYALLDKNKEH